MSIASALLERHLQTLVGDPATWQTLITDDVVWELAYAPAIGHPARLAGRAEVTRHVAWFLGAVEVFRFIEPTVHACVDPDVAVAQVRAEALIKPTGRVYRQEYVVFLRSAGRSIAHMREYFDPTRAAKAMNEPILDLPPWF
jgi:ketosteroid isomerase-like protein